MLQNYFGSRGQAAPRMAGAAGLALLFLLNVSWSLLPHRKPHPANMTQRATAVYPVVVVPGAPKHPAAVAQATPKPTPVPKPQPKPTPAPPAAVAQATPRPAPSPEPRKKHKVADMTLRAAAVGPLLPLKPKRPAVAAADDEPSPHADATPAPEPTPPAAEEVRRIGVVRVIGTGGTFLLIEARDSDVGADLPNGSELRCRGSAETGGAQTALLRVSPERRAPFIVADIVSGSPQVGDGVYLPDAASPPR